MAKPNKNSRRQKLIALDVGKTMTFLKSQTNKGSLTSQLTSLKEEVGQSYSYETFPKTIVVTRIS